MLCAEARIDKGFFPYEPGLPDAMIHNDHLATPQKMTDSSGTVVWAADYKPFGEATITVSTITNNLRFPGQYYDAETGLNYNYYRDYNPALGRYPQADPIGLWGGLNLYAYVRNNSANKIDPFGLVDIFYAMEADIVPIIGQELGAGIVIDLDDIGESGIFVTRGPAIGANLGIGSGGGIVLRELEDYSINIDVNAKTVSGVVMFDSEGFNGIAGSMGPGLGASVSLAKTTTLSINDVVKFFRDLLNRLKNKKANKKPC